MDRISRCVRAVWVAGLVSLLMVGAGPARAAFPGANGRLASQPANGRGLLWSVKPIPFYAVGVSLSYAHQQPSLTRKKLRRLEITAGAPKYSPQIPMPKT